MAADAGSVRMTAIADFSSVRDSARASAAALDQMTASTEQLAAALGASQLSARNQAQVIAQMTAAERAAQDQLAKTAAVSKILREESNRLREARAAGVIATKGLASADSEATTILKILATQNKITRAAVAELTNELSRQSAVLAAAATAGIGLAEAQSIEANAARERLVTNARATQSVKDLSVAQADAAVVNKRATVERSISRAEAIKESEAVDKLTASYIREQAALAPVAAAEARLAAARKAVASASATTSVTASRVGVSQTRADATTAAVASAAPGTAAETAAVERAAVAHKQLTADKRAHAAATKALIAAETELATAEAAQLAIAGPLSATEKSIAEARSRHYLATQASAKAEGELRAAIAALLGVEATGTASANELALAHDRVAVASGVATKAAATLRTETLLLGEAQAIVGAELTGLVGAIARADAALLGLTAAEGAAATGLTALSTKNRVVAEGLRNGVGGAAVIATLGLGYLGAKGVASFSHLTEQVTKSQQVFLEFTPLVQDFAKSAANGFGQSERAALKASTQFALLLQVAGVTRQRSAEMSIALTKLAADLASFHDVAGGAEEVGQRLQSALVGQARAVRILGIDTSESRVKAEAYTSGIAEQGTALTAAQRKLAIYNIIMRDSATAQGDFGRTAGQFANQVRTLKANVENISASLGRTLIPAAIAGAKGINALVAAFAKIPFAAQSTIFVFAGVSTVAIALTAVLDKLKITSGLAGKSLKALGSPEVLGAVAVVSALAVGIRYLNDQVQDKQREAIEGYAKALDNAFKNRDASALVAQLEDLQSKITKGPNPVKGEKTPLSGNNVVDLNQFRNEVRVQAGYARKELELQIKTIFGKPLTPQTIQLALEFVAGIKDPKLAQEVILKGIDELVTANNFGPRRLELFLELLPKVENKDDAKKAIDRAIEDILKKGISSSSQAEIGVSLLDTATAYGLSSKETQALVTELQRFAAGSKAAAEATTAQGQSLKEATKLAKEFDAAVAKAETANEAVIEHTAKLNAARSDADKILKELTTHEEQNAEAAKLNADHIKEEAAAQKAAADATDRRVKAEQDLAKAKNVDRPKAVAEVTKAEAVVAQGAATIQGLKTPTGGAEEATAAVRARVAAATDKLRIALAGANQTNIAYAQGQLDAANADLAVAKARDAVLEAEKQVAVATQAVEDTNLAYQQSVRAVEAAERTRDKALQAMANTLNGFPAGSREAVQATLDLESAEISAKEAALGLADATSALTDAQTELAGAAAAAARIVEDAERGLRDAREGQAAAARSARDADEGLAAARKQQKQATDDLTAAQAAFNLVAHGYAADSREVADATQDVTDKQRAARSATLDIADANKNLIDSQKAVRDSTFALAEAQDALADAKRRASDIPLDRRSAELDLADALGRVKEAQDALAKPKKGDDPAKLRRDLERAQIEAQRRRNALDDLPRQEAAVRRGVTQAANAVADQPAKVAADRRGVQRAELAVAEANSKSAAASQAVADAQENLINVSKGYPPTSKEYIAAAKAVADAQDGVRAAAIAARNAQEGVDAAAIAQRNAAEAVGAAELAVSAARTEAANKITAAQRGLTGAMLAQESAALRVKTATQQLNDQRAETEGTLHGYKEGSDKAKDAFDALQGAIDGVNSALANKASFEGPLGQVAGSITALDSAMGALADAQLTKGQALLTKQQEIAGAIKTQETNVLAVVEAKQALVGVDDTIKEKEKELKGLINDEKIAADGVLATKKKIKDENAAQAKKFREENIKAQSDYNDLLREAVTQAGLLAAALAQRSAGGTLTTGQVAAAEAGGRNKEAAGQKPLPGQSKQTPFDPVAAAAAAVPVKFAAKLQVDEAALKAQVDEVVNYATGLFKAKPASVTAKIDDSVEAYQNNVGIAGKVRDGVNEWFKQNPAAITTKADPVTAQKSAADARKVAQNDMNTAPKVTLPVQPPVATPSVRTQFSNVGAQLGVEVANGFAAQVTTGVQAAINAIATAVANAKKAPSTGTTTTTTTQARAGGQTSGRALGGVIPGAGNSDTVPAMLTPGEFVVRKSAVRAYGVENLERINRFASGGMVVPNHAELQTGRVPVRATAARNVSAPVGTRRGDNAKPGYKPESNVPPGGVTIAVYNPIGQPAEESIFDALNKAAYHGVLGQC